MVVYFPCNKIPGKSFLLNALLGSSSSFTVGASTQPKTAGLWILKTDFKAPDGSTILLLDSEGFFGSEVSEEFEFFFAQILMKSYDAKIFALATLLSSHLVYNSIKLIDQAAVDYLELLARRTQLFQLKNRIANSSREIFFFVGGSCKVPLVRNDEFPHFTWVVKDFVQDLEGRDANYWLQQFTKKHRDRGLDEFGGKGLESVFKTIECQTLFLPGFSSCNITH